MACTWRRTRRAPSAIVGRCLHEEGAVRFGDARAVQSLGAPRLEKGGAIIGHVGARGVPGRAV